MQFYVFYNITEGLKSATKNTQDEGFFTQNGI